MIPRFVKTRNHHRRRLTLHHAAAMRRARALTLDTIESMSSVWHWIDTWHGSGWAGISGAGVGPYPRCLSRSRRAIAETWED
jgi:hypothetical protein